MISRDQKYSNMVDINEDENFDEWGDWWELYHTRYRVSDFYNYN